MRPSLLFLLLLAVVAAPVALALTAFFTGLWQRRPELPPLRDDELGT